MVPDRAVLPSIVMTGVTLPFPPVSVTLYVVLGEHPPADVQLGCPLVDAQRYEGAATVPGVGPTMRSWTPLFQLLTVGEAPVAGLRRAAGGGRSVRSGAA